MISILPWLDGHWVPHLTDLMGTLATFATPYVCNLPAEDEVSLRIPTEPIPNWSMTGAGRAIIAGLQETSKEPSVSDQSAEIVEYKKKEKSGKGKKKEESSVF